MAKDGFVQVPPQSTGQKVDGSSISVQGQVVIRQRIILGDPVASAGFANVVSGALSVRIEAQSATVNVALTTLPNVNISVMPSVTLAANAATNIGIINNISRTVTVVGTVALLAGAANIGTINNISAAVATLPGPVAISGTAVVSGVVNVSATATVIVSNFLAGSGQSVNLVDTANTALRVNVVAGAGGGANPVSIAAGTSNIGFINNISAAVVVTGISGTAVAVAGTVAISNPVSLVSITGTVVVSGQVSVTGSVAVSSLPGNIGTVNNISAAVVIAAGANNIGTINNISAQVAISGSVTVINNINISAMPAIQITAGAQVIVQGPVAHSLSCTAGVAPLIMGGRAHISASANVSNLDVTYAWLDLNGRQITQLNHTSLLPSASHGPRSVIVAGTAVTALVAAPGAGLSIYVSGLMVTNGSGTLTRADILTGANTASVEVVAYIAANGGGFSREFNPPWKISANAALNARVEPSVSTSSVVAMVHFFVGPT